MSSSLVKLSLSLFADDIPSSDEPKKRKKTKDPMSMISSKKVGVKKELRKLERKKLEVRKARIKQNSSNKYHNLEPTDYTEESLQALRRVSQLDSTDHTVSKSVVASHHKGKLKLKGSKQKPKKEEESTLFTDKDFEDFINDYDFTKHKKKHR